MTDASLNNERAIAMRTLSPQQDSPNAKPPTGLLIVVVATINCLSIAHGECTFDWRPGNGISGVDGPVYAMTSWDPDGIGPMSEVMVLGGSFDHAGELSAVRAVIWDGTNWQSLPGMGTENFSIVRSLKVFNGELYAGGTFRINGGPKTQVAKWTASGWLPIGLATEQTNAPIVYALELYKDELIAAGTFRTGDGAITDHIARWNGTSWQPLSSGVSGYVYSLTQYNGELIAGGIFDTAGGETVNKIARWNGTNWQPLGNGVPTVYRDIFSLGTHAGKLIAGGYFENIGNVSAQNIATWDGASWQAMGSGLRGYVYAVGEYNGELLAGGDFDSVCSNTPDGIARWDGTSWKWLGTGIGTTGNRTRVFSLSTYGGELLAGTSFSPYQTFFASYISRWNGTKWRPLVNGFNGTVEALITYQGNLSCSWLIYDCGGVNSKLCCTMEWHALGDPRQFSGRYRALSGDPQRRPHRRRVSYCVLVWAKFGQRDSAMERRGLAKYGDQPGRICHNSRHVFSSEQANCWG